MRRGDERGEEERREVERNEGEEKSRRRGARRGGKADLCPVAKDTTEGEKTDYRLSVPHLVPHSAHYLLSDGITFFLFVSEVKI